jgi:hypothetical protein
MVFHLVPVGGPVVVAEVAVVVLEAVGVVLAILILEMVSCSLMEGRETSGLICMSPSLPLA